MFDIQAELKKLPDAPGVYLMKDKQEEIIYIGKAKVLKNRVRQYFQNSKNQLPKVKAMVSHVAEFEYIVTNSEVEALILECNLIKKYRPRYNVLLKDDKAYPYIKLTLNEAYPRLLKTRKAENDKAKYYGPYTDVGAVDEILELIYKLWPVRKCQRILPRDIGKERPCLNYHIGQCQAPCNNLVSKEGYKEIIEKVQKFLEGNKEDFIKNLEQEMNQFSENMEFEKAAETRDKILAIKRLKEKQKVESASADDQDVIAFARAFDEAMMQVFFIRNGKMIGRENFLINNVEAMSRGEVMTEFIKQFYSGTAYIPKELILQEEIEDKEIIKEWLSSLKGQKVAMTVPQKGDKQGLVEMAGKNAIIMLEKFGEQMKRETNRTKGAMEEIQKALHLDKQLKRIEAYDISNVQGFESVGSMVVFEDGKPKRSDYRKFKIKTVKGANDYASMHEVITRRFLHMMKELEEIKNKNMTEGKFTKIPDMLFIDGGASHVNVVENALAQLNVDILVCGMVKDDRHRTRGLIFKGEEIKIPFTSEGFKLITRIQDEVHRFAIEYHRKLREKNQTRSILDTIEGIGETRRIQLLKHFGTIEKIKQADLDELEAVSTMNKKSALEVYNFFNRK